MKNWILTGGVATGKSFVRQMLIRHWAQKTESFSADESASRSLCSAKVVNSLVKEFGSQVLLQVTPLVLNKKWLREAVLPNPVKRALLESLIHPFVLAELKERRRQAVGDGVNLFVAELPLLYETKSVIFADLVIAVAASRSVQVRRMMENRALDERAVNAFFNAQLPTETKTKKADVVIWNDGDSTALQYQVMLLANYSRIQ